MRMEFSECINETLANEGRTYFRIEYKSNFSLSIYIVAKKAEVLAKNKWQTGSLWQTRLSIRFNNNWGIDGRDGEGRDRMSL